MHSASEILKWDFEKRSLIVRFNREHREIDLSALFKNHFELKRLAVIPAPKLEKGGIKIGPVLISGPTAYHMGMPLSRDAVIGKMGVS